MPGLSVSPATGQMVRYRSPSAGRMRGANSTSSTSPPARRSRPRCWPASAPSTRSKPTYVANPPSGAAQARNARSRRIADALHDWLHANIGRVSGTSDLAEAMRYTIRHWAGLVLFLDDGRVELDTNVVERAIRPIALARKNALFAGSDGGARHWAIAMTLIATAKLNAWSPWPT